MSSVVSTSTSNASDELPPFPVRRFTVEEYFELGRMDFFGDDDKVELLQGYIVPKMVKYPPHERVLYRLVQFLQTIVPPGWFIRLQGVLQTADSAPEPDISLTRGTADDYPESHPRGKDVALVIEVADSSIKRDRRKIEVYGNEGVPVYWIVNIREQCFEIYEQPRAGIDGKLAYTSRRVVAGNEAIALLVDGRVIANVQPSQFLLADFSPTEPT